MVVLIIILIVVGIIIYCAKHKKAGQASPKNASPETFVCPGRVVIDCHDRKDGYTEISAKTGRCDAICAYLWEDKCSYEHCGKKCPFAETVFRHGAFQGSRQVDPLKIINITEVSFDGEALPLPPDGVIRDKLPPLLTTGVNGGVKISQSNVLSVRTVVRNNNDVFFRISIIYYLALNSADGSRLSKNELALDERNGIEDTIGKQLHKFQIALTDTQKRENADDIECFSVGSPDCSSLSSSLTYFYSAYIPGDIEHYGFKDAAMLIHTDPVGQ
ncbi:MAG: hypothetical protein J5449_09040 [Oscillospiraceae bacterium]|nr:hypothetical protein [Oscillospiraceae bacterium]